MKKKYLLLIISLLLIPTIVFASSNSSSSTGSDLAGFSVVISVFHTIFIILPIVSKGKFFEGLKPKDFFKIYFIVLIVNIICASAFGDIWYGGSVIAIFIAGIPITSIFSKGTPNRLLFTSSIIADPTKTIPGCATGIIIRCTKCNASLNPNDKFCPECGTEFAGDNAKVEKADKSDMALNPTDFDAMYNKPEEALINDIITEEMTALELDPNTTLIPASEKTRLIVLNIIFSVLLFLYIGLIFYHVNVLFYVVGLIVLIVFFIKKSKIDLKKYILKEIKARPNENIDNVIGAIKENLVPRRAIVSGILLPIFVLIGSALVFKEPIIFYEPLDDGYAMRFYFTGWNSLRYATIPAEHNGKPVVSLRGNAFSNMPLLKEVYLPDSITEIRGEAFKNDYALEKVHLPAKLQSLGGESFFNCYNLKEVNLTFDTPLDEIRGDTFEECHLLKEITIPDSVKRIGGHAFYNDYSLTKVNISANSHLEEIGSSAFRLCNSLKTIKLPSKAQVNGKAFKESPTVISYFSSVDEYNSPTVDDTSSRSFMIFLYEYAKINVSNYGTLTFENISFDTKTKYHVIRVTGFKEAILEFDRPTTYQISDKYYIELQPSTTTAAVYGYLKSYIQ